MFSRFTSKFIHWFVSTIELQLFLLIASLPILVCWGLPISWLSVLGNIIFAPFLCLFLAIAASMCSITLLGINNWLCAGILNACTQCWYWCMSHASASVLFYIPQPIFFLLLIPWLLLFFLYKHPRSYHAQSMRICGLSMIMMFTVCVWKIVVVPQEIMLNNQCMIKGDAQGFSIQYKGNAPRNGQAWVKYTLIPHCAKAFGSVYCRSLRINKLTPSHVSFIELCIKELLPRKISWEWADKKLREKLELLLIQYGYQKKKGNHYALPVSY